MPEVFEQPEIPGAAAVFEPFEALGWGELEPERREQRAAAGNYEGVGDDNPYAT